MFEEYKVELENRWRSLLDDAIQDAVFLHARNNEIAEENAKLKLGKFAGISLYLKFFDVFYRCAARIY